MSNIKYEIFEKVAEVGNITKAAELLGCTQSGVSRSLIALEKDLGLNLVSRGRNGAVLTKEGQFILSDVKNLLKAEASLKKTAASLRGKIGGKIRIGAFTSVAVHWLPRIIKEFDKSNSNIDIGLMNGDYHDINEWLKDGSIDIGFVTLPCEVDGCEVIPLMEDRLMAVLPNDHRLAGKNRIAVSQIENEDFISLMENSDHDARRALESAGVKVNVKFTTKDDYAIIAMVEQGLGVSIMPELLLSGSSENICAIELENGARRTIGIAMPNGHLDNVYVRLFAEHIRKWVAERYK
ncbi:MAG: LysR family transcriptional regulator [Eubacteriales bacterium]|nr:LysR family transcriptional regulator [Eubacteriales bacterium]